MSHFPPTRAAALMRLQDFLPRAAADYARDRNLDRGPTAPAGVSQLSPYVRHRLLGEDELIRAVLGRYAYAEAARFIDEVCWRTYWKGWLQLRPAIWHRYLDSVRDGSDAVARNAGLRSTLAAAEDGRTGIDCFDTWVRQLVQTGYLHNHARMWFASIWIFTLRLPWALGADFFLRHLLDGDAASNTLSWRWVAGLQTPGKHYLARAENIARFTGGRFNPLGQLDETAASLPADALPDVQPLVPPPAADPHARSGWLLHEDDLRAQWPAGAGLMPVAIAVLRPSVSRALAVEAWVNPAIDDALQRAAQSRGLPGHACVDEPDIDRMIDRLSALQITQLITAEAPVGPACTQLDTLAPRLAARGIALIRLRREWDTAFWPQASRGFFPFRKNIEQTLRELGISAADAQT